MKRDPDPETASRLRVVIVGGGFGGLACARALDGAPVEVLLIDRDNHHRNPVSFARLFQRRFHFARGRSEN